VGEIHIARDPLRPAAALAATHDVGRKDDGTACLVQDGVRFLDDSLDGSHACNECGHFRRALGIVGDQTFAVCAGAIGAGGQCIKLCAGLCVDRGEVTRFEQRDAFLDSELSVATLVDLSFDAIECSIVARLKRGQALAGEVDFEVLLDEKAATLVVDTAL
jgi:hypothetical protein